jgi:hypothetical protein
MVTRLKVWLLAAVIFSLPTAQAAELTGRVSVLGTAARGTGSIDTPNADQESLRLMLDDIQDSGAWSIHVKMSRQHLSGYPAKDLGPSDLFRYRGISGDWLAERSANSLSRIGYELDRAVYRRRFGNVAVGLGRQPIDWGAGRFWQPMNVFGAFAPTDLDTDYKPGIDGAVLDWYPSEFSSLTMAYVLSPEGSAPSGSGAVHYRRQVGERSEMALLAGQVIGNRVFGASFESEWRGMGWRIEGVHYNMPRTNEDSVFWIAGVDYQFSDTTLVSAEWHDNSRGATNEADLAGMQSDRLVVYRLQQQLGRSVLGINVKRDLSPLLQASYTMLAGILDDANDRPAASILHQLNFIYSVSNESDLLLSLLYASGKGLDQRDRLRSEFGSLPSSITLRYRHYF